MFVTTLPHRLLMWSPSTAHSDNEIEPTTLSIDKMTGSLPVREFESETDLSSSAPSVVHTEVMSTGEEKALTITDSSETAIEAVALGSLSEGKHLERHVVGETESVDSEQQRDVAHGTPRPDDRGTASPDDVVSELKIKKQKPSMNCVDVCFCILSLPL